MPTFRRLVAGATVAGAAVALVAAPAPAGAATRCTAWGSLPARVSLQSDRTVVTSVLRGTSACYNQRTDNGASASLTYPDDSPQDMRWRHFGATQSVVLYVNLVRSGTYSLRHGSVQLYDSRYERVPWAWAPTSMVVKRAARIVRISAAGGVVAGRALAFTKYGWIGYHSQLVYVQRRPVNGSGWRTLGSVRPADNGRFAFGTPTPSGYEFRMFLRASATVWDGHSFVVRGGTTR